MRATEPARVAEDAAACLTALAGPGAILRPDQLAAIEALVDGSVPVLVVQRTGWGKSAVYWIATALRRREGAGPTLVVSPLLALMRDQVAAAARMGLRAATVNSTNRDGWAAVAADLDADRVDVLLISPERLNNPQFRREVLPDMARRLGTLVVDECHCISDWGHDFRPDYRRLGDLIAALAPGAAVLGTTATANRRVTADVAAQLGPDTLTLRGPLGRDSLDLAVVPLATAAVRLAWVAEEVASSAGSGIVYCLTVAETDRVAGYLAAEGLAVASYSGSTDGDARTAIEDDLRANRLRAVVATSALGMGFDKGDLAFVIHLGSPSSPISYYQQVGRAGRAIDRASATLLPASTDADIWEWFDQAAFPPERLVASVLDAVGARGPVGVAALEAAVDLRRSRIEALLKVLDVEGAVERVDAGWVRTGRPWAYDHERIRTVREARAAEAAAMVAYAGTERCRMQQLRDSLDDTGSPPCGRCDVCRPRAVRPPDPERVERARRHLRAVEVVLEPRKLWPAGLEGRRGRIARQAEPGRALAFGNDPGWGEALTELLESSDGAAAVDLDPVVAAGCVAALHRWEWAARPAWVTWVPSRRRPGLARAVAAHLAAAGHLPLLDALARAADRPPQASMGNSARQAANALGAHAVADLSAAPAGPVLVVDDTWSSGWTMTVVAEAMRAGGAGPVLPFALWRRP